MSGVQNIDDAIRGIRKRKEIAKQRNRQIKWLKADLVAKDAKIAELTEHIEDLVEVVGKKDEQIRVLREGLEDLRDYGCRHDLNPTIGGKIKNLNDWAGWTGYIKSMDEYVREKAAKALQSKAAGGVKDDIEDGFGSSWSKKCGICGKDTMEVVRPGKVQCSNCG